MSRTPEMPAAMMAAFAGMQGGGGIATAFAVSLVMYTHARWQEPAGREFERARATAARYKLSRTSPSSCRHSRDASRAPRARTSTRAW